MGLNFDFGGGTKASGGFEPLPEGMYFARIDSIEVKNTQPKEGVEQKASDGTPAQYLNPCYKITDGDFEGRLIWGINSIRFPEDALDDTEKERTTRSMFLEWLNTVTGTDFSDTKQNIDLKDLVGQEVRLVVTQGEYQGRPKNDIKRVLPKEDNKTDVEEVRRAL